MGAVAKTYLPRFSPLVPEPRPPANDRAPPDDRYALQASWSLRIPARYTIFAMGDPTDGVFETSEGSVMILRKLPDGRRKIIDIVGPGRLFGFSKERRHDCSAESLSPCMILGYERASLSSHPAIAARVTTALMEEVHRLREVVSLLGRKSAMERVASFYAALLPDEDARRATVPVPVTRGEMADYLGLTIETVSRNVAKLKRLSVLGKELPDEIKVLDGARLRALARGEDADE
ncbi:MAG: Crp/Fnr family transcriptional regulator [Roseiarcus sp.]